MRALKRFGKPNILEKKQKEWTDTFIASGKPRPDANKYRNPAILSSLCNISHDKCFYCEALLRHKPSEIDHRVEVTVDKSLAFEWNNLYLSCKECNDGRPKETDIPIAEVLDPCSNTDAEIQDDITFVLHTIKGKTDRGKKTIQKFKLDNEGHETARMIHFIRMIEAISTIMRKDIYKNIGLRKIQCINDFDKETIMRFMDNAEPYSLMCEIYLKEKYPQLFP